MLEKGLIRDRVWGKKLGKNGKEGVVSVEADEMKELQNRRDE